MLPNLLKSTLRRAGYKIEKLDPLEESIPADCNRSPFLPTQWIDDYWFTEETFRAEMRDAGFRVATMLPVRLAWPLQYYTWTYLWRLSPFATQVVSRALEVVTPREPLEWMALCACE
jgi:hypothetical protein